MRVGSTIPDACLRGPRQEVDVDGFFWTNLNGVPDNSSLVNCPTATTRGSFRLDAPDSLTFITPAGATVPFAKVGRSVQTVCG